MTKSCMTQILNDVASNWGYAKNSLNSYFLKKKILIYLVFRKQKTNAPETQLVYGLRVNLNYLESINVF